MLICAIKLYRDSIRMLIIKVFRLEPKLDTSDLGVENLSWLAIDQTKKKKEEKEQKGAEAPFWHSIRDQKGGETLLTPTPDTSRKEEREREREREREATVRRHDAGT